MPLLKQYGKTFTFSCLFPHEQKILFYFSTLLDIKYSYSVLIILSAYFLILLSYLQSSNFTSIVTSKINAFEYNLCEFFHRTAAPKISESLFSFKAAKMRGKSC